MYYDEAILLVKEGYHIQRQSWGDSYIYMDDSGNIKYISINRINGHCITFNIDYYPSKSDLSADDWKEK